ncbi:amino acid permease [Rickettsiella endosymbiont of Litargus connexus]|jgi:tyrosine-specific transport protein|uniref:amino acid permease n=1 Tax=Rickettsiella endosymbiont of Litargus connexus TaxID=3066237 RepID=UPI0027EC5DD3|nr:tryptophan/tyrosine permease [Gammaproteobacteria bacterium]MCH9754578.1 tryptophan/tyrosine permease [Gammaproteobacteria bacterium]MDD4892945.1 aromatic amino acid transport family protein [Candidatus Rickettsiella isopodorum]MDD5161492.1 aromatic amino acid transport family protein [Candidatus Rickettsiella isopodorum]MDQ5899608.1 tyrosine-specific transport protein [Pseudomonadota bacterium]
MFNKLDTKLLGGILLIVGTAIGGGMLALPIATAEAGFTNSLILLFLCWFIMTVSAFLVLEVNLWLPANTNIISMSRILLGRWGESIAWISYLLLFYSVLAAYMAGGGDFLSGLLLNLGVKIPSWASILLFIAILSYIVYQGIHYVDYVNRGLMFSKLSIYVLLILFIIPSVSDTKLKDGNILYLTSGATVMITSFTFANIIPSLRTYFKDDIPKLRKAILIGSLIPLFCYLFWNLCIMGVLPREGNYGLINMLHSKHSTSEFVMQLSNKLNNPLITFMARIFTSICLATSFLASGLSLSDFLADGLRTTKRGKGGLIVYLATFLPPLTVVLFYPGAFIGALSYAGIYCAILFILLPSLMVWRGRYRKNPLAKGFRVKGGRPLLLGLGIAGVLFISNGVQIALT